ncbi:MAG: hypothetical protein LC749_02290 [Actinobacteria bacterium]|nr:hypothetical protein [Actinomycetota bacterium]
MTREIKQVLFRPDPELAAQLAEYADVEHRRSINEVVSVLCRQALEQWRLSRTNQNG